MIFLISYGECLMPYYDEVAIKGAQQGILCFGHDHTGHGHSSGDRVQVHFINQYGGIPYTDHGAQIPPPRIPYRILLSAHAYLG